MNLYTHLLAPFVVAHQQTAAFLALNLASQVFIPHSQQTNLTTSLGLFIIDFSISYSELLSLSVFILIRTHHF